MEAVLFDFGGTLDADGVAWKERVHAYYRDEGLDLDEEKFARHFYDADDPLVGGIPDTTGFDETVHLLTANIERALTDGDPARGARVARRFIADSREAFSRNAEILKKLSGRYSIGVVSNFYGNLEAVCRDAGIAPYLGVAVDSTAVGVEKPDPGIFQAALDALGKAPEDCLFVGDSLRRDAVGARAMGMTFVWVGAEDADHGEGERPDHVIARVVDIEQVLP